MSNIIEVKVVSISDTKSFDNTTFTKKELVGTTEEQYPQTLLVEFPNDKADLLNNVKEGDKIKIHYNLRGRKVTKDDTDMYFMSLSAWKIEEGVKF